MITGVLALSLATGCCCIASRSSPAIAEPFSEKQFGEEHLRFHGMDLSLERPVLVLILAPQDRRALGEGSLETIFYRPGQGLRGRSGQPEEIREWLHTNLQKALGSLPRVQPLSPAHYKDLRYTDLALTVTVTRADVGFHGFSNEYTAHVVLEVSCRNRAKQDLFRKPLICEATLDKDVVSGRGPSTPIKPLLDKCFEKAIQSLLDNAQFLLLLRQAALEPLPGPIRTKIDSRAP